MRSIILIKLSPLLYLLSPFFLLLLTGCYSYTYSPAPFDESSDRADIPFKNSKTKTRDKLKITIAVLNEEESKNIFGVPTLSKGVEPVWIKIENGDTVPFVLFPIEVDPNYYSPGEAARKTHYPLSDETNSQIDEQFRKHFVEQMIEPGETVSGFVYTEPDLGIKEFKILLVGPGKVVNSYFLFPVPGLRLDIRNLEIDQHRTTAVLEDTDGSVLREKLEEFPCCTSNKEGTKDGDPLNLVVIGHLEDFLPYFIGWEWDVTEDIYISSVYREVLAFFLGSEYRYAPISNLYVFGRRQDIALQKSRQNIYARNHFRLWLTDFSYKGEPIWIGQISRDIGVSFTTKHWWLSTHDIDPHIDEARNFLVQELLLSHGVKKFGFVRGMEPQPVEKPLFNFMEQPIYTDGLRAVFIFDQEHTDISKLGLFHWEWSEQYQLEGKIEWKNPDENEGASQDRFKK